jgi:hypothetical protein
MQTNLIKGIAGKVAHCWSVCYLKQNITCTLYKCKSFFYEYILINYNSFLFKFNIIQDKFASILLWKFNYLTICFKNYSCEQLEGGHGSKSMVIIF